MADVIDLNCDLGEGAGNDAALMPLVSSANIACGGHAGDEGTMRATVELARRHGVAIGAHPGYEDREHFGRRELPFSPDAVRALVDGQVRRLSVLARVTHVKPHGALYNQAARDPVLARAVAEAVAQVDSGLILVGLAGSCLIEAGRAVGLRVAGEGFVDRRYAADGTLVPRAVPGAVVEDETEAVRQACDLILHRRIKALDGSWVDVAVDTLCLHGDGAHAVAFARRLRTELAAQGIAVRAVVPPLP